MSTISEAVQAMNELNDATERFIGEQRSKSAGYDQRLEQIETLVNRMALSYGSPSGGGKAAEPFRLPSMKEYREHEIRAQAIGNDANGGYLVTTEVGSYFDGLRPATAVLQAGPVLVTMNSDALELPGLAGSTTVTRVGEGGTLTDSDATFKKVRLTARKYAVRTVASSEWLSDANPDARGLLATDHSRQLAAKLDLEMLEGNGTGIVGLRYISGITSTSLGANGATPSLDNIADALYRLEAANADMSKVAIIMHPRTWNTFGKLKDGQTRYQLQPDPTTDARRSLFGRPVYTSPQMTITETVGSSSDCSYIVIADMSRVVVGRRLTLGVLYDPFSKSSTDQVVVQTLSRWDMNVLHTAAVEILTGVRP